MANNFDNNITRLLARIFLPKFDSERVLSKNVNTQLLEKVPYKPSSGDTIDFKRPTDYTSTRTSAGDISSITKDSIQTGKATATVQDYFTATVDYNEADEAIKMDQIEELLAPMATRLAVDMELDFAKFMMANTGLVAGVIDNPVTLWSHIAEAGAIMRGTGLPSDKKWCYAVNPFTQVALADTIRSLGAGGVAGEPIKGALERAVITDNFAGMRVMTATTLGTYTTPADIVGAFDGTPTVTYAAAADSMTVTVTVDGLTDGQIIQAGTLVTLSTLAVPQRLNQSTRELILDADGNTIDWQGVVTTTAEVGDVDPTGEVVLTLAGAPVFDTAGAGLNAFNNVNSALLDGTTVTFGGTASTTYQPNLFWHPDAFGIGFVPMKKLNGWDTIATTEDGIQLRVTRYSDGDKNLQQIRFDLRPAYASLNPYFAGQGYGQSTS